MTDMLEHLRRKYTGHQPGLLGARRNYAVLCPLVQLPEGPGLLFEVRAASLRRQPGEVCFPGGRMEPGESATDCALREAQEELAIPPSQVEVWGTPDFLCTQAGFLLQPVLGLVSPEGLAGIRPSPAEVAETFTVPLSFFSTHPPEVYRYESIPQVPADFPYAAVGIPEDYAWSRARSEVPVWHWGRHVIWGMTARVVGDLIQSM